MTEDTTALLMLALGMLVLSCMAWYIFRNRPRSQCPNGCEGRPLTRFTSTYIVERKCEKCGEEWMEYWG